MPAVISAQKIQHRMVCRTEVRGRDFRLARYLMALSKFYTIMQRNRFLPALLALASVLFFISCEKEDDNSTTVVYKATLNGSSEVPANASTATGDATLTFNRNTKIFTIVVNYSGLTVTNGHVHNGAVGVSGGVVFGFTGPFSSPINFTSPALTSEQEAALNAGTYYVNLHTAAYPDGEIRGQLTKQ